MPGMNFSIVGAGGTASHLIPLLVRMLNSDSPRFDDLIHVWDGDSVEEKNLKRQMFRFTDIGQPKASVWHGYFGDIIVPHPEYVGEANIAGAVQEYDIVFICADNMAVRRLIDAQAQSLRNITVINGGNEMFTGSCQLHIRRDGVNITPPITYHSKEISESTDPDMAALSCAEIAELPGGEQTMAANATVAVLMLQAYLRIAKFVVDQTDKQWTKMTFDIHSGVWQGSDVRMQGEDWR